MRFHNNVSITKGVSVSRYKENTRFIMASFATKKQELKTTIERVFTSRKTANYILDEIKKYYGIDGMVEIIEEKKDVNKALKKGMWKLQDMVDLITCVNEEDNGEFYTIIETEHDLSNDGLVEFAIDTLCNGFEADFRHQFSFDGVEHNGSTTKIFLTSYNSSKDSIIEYTLDENGVDYSFDKNGNILVIA